ncbi:group III truncated hemoglobin [Dyella sp. 20L07]|uniref:group III truncated hemoglobin n=1 Tax=Dyella sp. 20L07 TaxID=3384240 RepID=UPI003D29849C
MTTFDTSQPFTLTAFRRSEIDEASIATLVDRFYDKVRADGELGPVFNRVVEDWPAHKLILCHFWSSLVLRTGRYQGNPMGIHRALPPFPKALFHRWLALWRETAGQVFEEAAAATFIGAAERVAQGLSLGLNLGSLANEPTPSVLGSLRIVSGPSRNND